MGYIAVVAAIVASLAAAFLWDKFGGKNNKVKIIIVWVVSIALITLTMFIIYLIYVQIALDELASKGEIFDVNAFDGLILLLSKSTEFKNIVLFDTLVSYVFIIAGNIYTTIQILKTQKLTSQTLIKL